MARVVILLATAAIAAFAPAAGAQALSDPTRPPPEFMGPGAIVADTTGSLQSILISAERKAAVINGQLVPLGGMYGQQQLVAITPTEVTLRSEQSVEVLKLYPSVEKTARLRRTAFGRGEVSK
jgi:hypothetical protein